MNEPSDDDWLGLRHLALEVNELETMERFYCDLLGFRVEWRPDADNVYLTSGPDNLALHRVPARVVRGSLDHLGFVVNRPGAVDKWFDRVRSFGATVVQLPKTHRDGARSFYFEDPEGNRVQLIFHPPLAEQPGSPDPRSGG